jgi:competence protein ComEC
MEEGYKKKCLFEVTKLQESQNFFTKKIICHGKLTHNNKCISCMIFFNENQKRLEGSKKFELEGILKKNQDNYTFKLKHFKEIAPNPFSFAEESFSLKKKIQNLLRLKTASKQASSFLEGLFCGQVNDMILKHDLRRVGLQHILAVSGFHFSVLSFILFLPLKLLLPPRIATFLLMVILTSYFIFIGNSPSVLRAWLSCMILMGGFLIKRPSFALNRLGFALIICLCNDPLNIKAVGFTLSFAATASILFFFSPAKILLSCLFSKKKFSEALKLPFHKKCFIILSSYLKNALSMMLAVNIITFPLLIYYFGYVPLLSFLYNLFIPFLVTFSMFFLILSLILEIFIPSLADLFYLINSSFTDFYLRSISHIPEKFHVNFYIQSIDASFICIYISLVIFIAILINDLTDSKNSFLEKVL